MLRRIIRRAIRHGKKLGVKDVFFYKLVAPLCAEMGDAYPELRKSQAHVEKVLKKEEQRFLETLDQGMEILEAAIDQLDGSEIPGIVAFKLYDTYGFPLDLTADIARERQLTIDQSGFDVAMNEQRSKAKAASKFATSEQASIKSAVDSDFRGYVTIEESSAVAELYRDGDAVDSLSAGEHGVVILHSTPFYAESGGQIGDTGQLTTDGVRFDVVDTQKAGQGIAHIGTLAEGSLTVGNKVNAVVDGVRRAAIVLNHSATHLMHAALRRVLGDHVIQKGSLVAPDRLRFDFSHYEPVTTEQIQAIEAIVNDQIRANVEAQIELMSYDKAIESGAMALFGEKYGDEVRVLRFGEFSVELCGGTHVQRTGDIGLFKITSEGGVASGVRRIEAVTGRGALAWVEANQQRISDVASLLKSTPEQTAEKVDALLRRTRELEKELAAARQALATGGSADASKEAVDISGVKVLAARVDGADAKTLRDAVDRYKDKLQTAVVVLGSVEDGKVRLAAGVTKNATDRIRAGDVIQPVAEQVGGRGGGRPDFAQAGGSNPAALDAALASVCDWVSNQLNQA